MVNDESELKLFEGLESELKLKGLSKSTIRSYLFWNNKFLKTINKKPNEVVADDIKNYLASLNATSTRRLAKFALGEVYKKIFNTDLAELTLTEKYRKRLPQVLTEEEVLKLFTLPNQVRHIMQLKLMYYCGLRVSEMMNLTVEDISLKDGYLKVVRGKFGKDRFVPLPKPLIRELNEYLKGKEGKLFTTGIRSVQKMVTRSGKKLGKPIHPHTLRHSYATHILESTNNLELVRDLLGHSNIQSTTIYTHLTMKAKKKSVDDVWK